MRSISVNKGKTIDDNDCFIEIDIDKPTATGYDILVSVKAVSVNPVDTKLRGGELEDGEYRILGFDGAGVVAEAGEKVDRFAIGDNVYYAGAINRSGSNSEFQLVDSRIVGKMPKTLSYLEAAALPLTTLTAWESLYNHLNLKESDTILMIGGAGGVGSIAIQLAKSITNATVIATASRKESISQVHSMGADISIDHYSNIKEQLEELGIDEVEKVLLLNSIDEYLPQIPDITAPFGDICGLANSSESLDMNSLKSKSISFHWEFMFTRSLYQTKDMIEQAMILDKVSELVDKKMIKTTFAIDGGELNSENLRLAHRYVEGGKSCGKICLNVM